jgi:hypothetical protein
MLRHVLGACYSVLALCSHQACSIARTRPSIHLRRPEDQLRCTTLLRRCGDPRFRDENEALAILRYLMSMLRELRKTRRHRTGRRLRLFKTRCCLTPSARLLLAGGYSLTMNGGLLSKRGAEVPTGVCSSSNPNDEPRQDSSIRSSKEP